MRCRGALRLAVAARETGLRPEVLSREIARGRLRGVRLGRRWWVAVAELDRWRAGWLGHGGGDA